ncbi:alpha-amylase 2-like [Cataglyphis hispanica]|uniref:alpha-amylase 2-like n=1 Tax=Cataglyphis hispanica TaxID=1086592 RepID=UPI00218042A2|nr:alpha-amylase 2-like [Cataglyphis hispanica]
MSAFVLIFTSFLAIALAQKDPHYMDGRTTMVHLFEWKFNDIAKECEDFLGPMGYGGVQVSPVNENLIIDKRPWYERYQPLSYKIISRSGTESEFKDMIERCKKVGVQIYVDAVINHMTADILPAYGTGGTSADPKDFSYPGVPYTSQDFHTPPCQIQNYNNATEVRDCELSGLHDLDQSKEHVRNEIIGFFNRITDLGIAGLRIDAAKHMWPQDLGVIYNRTKNLSAKAGFLPSARPYIYQEVIDLGGEAVSKFEYTDLGNVIEFQYGIILGSMFRGQDKLARLETFNDPKAWRMLSPDDALVMVDNHDNQRGHGAGGSTILTYKDPKPYKMAIAFMLAYPYGHPRIMSSFAFTDPNKGPPADSDGNIISPEISNGQCVNGWVCEHRWPQIYHMAHFRNLVNDEPVENWWTDGKNQIAFSRGSKGFIALNVEGDLSEKLQTGLPAGTYCDVMTGNVVNGQCTGKSVQVDSDGRALIEILSDESEGALALHIQAKL